MKRITALTLTILALSCSAAFAQEYSMRTGIVDFHSADKKNADEAKQAVSELSAVLGQYKFIKLVERSELSALSEEIELGQLGVVDQKTAVKAQKVYGLQAVIDGSIRKGVLSVRVMYTETAQILATASGSVSDTGPIGKKLAAGIETFIAKENIRRLRNSSPEIDYDFWIETTGGKRVSSPDKPGKVSVGAPVSFRFKSNTSGFLTIVDIQAGGDIVVLYPNDFSGTNEIKADRVYSIPSESDGFEINATDAGEDTVVAFFTKKKVEWLDPAKISGEGFKTVKEGEKTGTARKLSVTATQLGKADWESCVVVLDVVK